MILTTKVVPGLALCIALTTVSILYYEGMGEAPRVFFGGDRAFLVAPPGGKLVGTATVPEGLAGPLRSLDYVDGVSAEIYVATSIQGRSVMARGVDFDSFATMEGARIVEGRGPQAPRDAVAGAGFAQAFSLGVGDHLVLPGSLSTTGLRVEIVGIAEVEGPAGEELLVTLQAARGLARVPATDVHLIRVATANRSEVKSLVESVSPTFTYSDVTLSTTTFLPGEPVTMRANLTNWGRIEGVKLVQVRQEGVAIADRAYRVPALATIPVEVEFSLDRAGRQNITINPTFVVDVGVGNLSFLDAPRTVVVGQRFLVRVVDAEGGPAEGANVTSDGTAGVTDAAGAVTLNLSAPGRHTLRAERDRAAGEIAVAEVYVVQPGLERAPSGLVVDLALGAVDYGTSRPIVARVLIENRGGVGGNVSVPILLDRAVATYANASLPPGERNWTTVTFRAPIAGNHTLAPQNGTVNARFRTLEGEDPAIQALLRGYDARADRPGFSSTSGDTADDYIRRTVGNLGAAVLILSVVSGGLASVGAVAVLARHVGERRASMGVVKALGARDAYLVEVVTWEAARFGALAAAIGVGAGALLAFVVDRLGIVRAFGHAIHPTLSWTVLGLVFLVGVLVLVIASRLLVKSALAAPADALLRAPGDATLPALPAVLGESR